MKTKTKTKTNNPRTLDQIAGDLHKLMHNSVFERGRLLVEAKDAHDGEFMAWLADEFGQGYYKTAERLMKVALRLDKLSNLKLAKSTLYDLCDIDDEKILTAIVAELAKHAKQRWLKPAEAARYIEIAEARVEHGDKYSEAALYALGQYDGVPAFQALADAIKAANPKTDAAVELIIKPIKEKAEAARKAREAKQAERDADRQARREQAAADRMDAEPDEPVDLDEPEQERARTPEPPPRPAQAMPGDIGPTLSASPEDELLEKAGKAFALAAYEGVGTISDELVDACDQAATAWKRLHSELRAKQGYRATAKKVAA